VLFKANSFSDLLDRLSMVQEIAAADRRRLKELQAAAQEVIEAQEALAVEKEALEATKEELALAQADLEVRQEEAEVLLEQLIAKGEEFEALIDESEDAQDALQAEIAQAEKDYKNQKYKEWLATSVPPTTKPPKPTGGSDGGVPVNPSAWRSPLTKPSWVTSPFGMRLHPVYKVWKMHKGVDLASSKGDQIVAVRSGVVSRATYDSASGYYVVVNHGDGFSSLYMHMTHYVVSVGQTVSAGQLLGYVGSTGVSTGPHLHFSITYNGTHVNPADYINFG
jgi:murein DD-endopeptidase MepM/ murein hydrolase activator NlpD